MFTLLRRDYFNVTHINEKQKKNTAKCVKSEGAYPEKLANPFFNRFLFIRKSSKKPGKFVPLIKKIHDGNKESKNYRS